MPRGELPSDARLLEELLRQALLVEPEVDTAEDAMRIERLQDFWLRESHKQATRRFKLAPSKWLVSSLVAASVAACAFFFLERDARDNAQLDQAPLNKGNQSDNMSVDIAKAPSTPASLTQDKTPSDDAPRRFGRPPTEYERIMFIARSSQQNRSSQPRSSRQHNARNIDSENVASIEAEARAAKLLRLFTSDSDESLIQYLSFVSNFATREEAIAIATQATQRPLERLMKLLDNPQKPIRLAAAVTLGRLNGPEVTKRLIDRVSNHPSESTEAWLALLICRGELAEEFCSYAARRPQLLGYYNNARLQWDRMTQ